jgi:3-oxoacyl-[acyl-carrier protein] reductase
MTCHLGRNAKSPDHAFFILFDFSTLLESWNLYQLDAEMSRTAYNVFITGGTGGIGHAIARKFASHPNHTFNILVISRDVSRAEVAIQGLERLHDSQKHSYMVGDITQATFWANLVKSCADIGPPTILINAAGFVITKPFIRTEDSTNDKMINANLMATLRACRYMGKPLRGSGDSTITPSIINISSVLGNMGGDGVAAYAAAKAGILGMHSHFLLVKEEC